MKQTYKTIDYEWLTRPTGDPFADAGGFAIEYLSEKFPEKDILELIDYINKIYVHKWNANLYMFFHNSKILQPAYKGDKKIFESNNYFKSLIQEKDSIGFGYCRITGREASLFIGGRNNSMLTGAGTLVNYHHFFQKGIALSKEALMRIHFVPFACPLLQGKIGLMQSSNETLSRLFVRMTIDKNLHEIATGISEGATKAVMNVPANEIFEFVDYSINHLAEFRNSNSLPSLTLYHFTNFKDQPNVKLYQLPSKVFLFYRTCLQPRFKEDWQRFVRSHYYDGQHKGAKYNLQSGTFELAKSKETEVIDFDDYKQWFNRILNKLLIGESIRPEVLRWSRKNPFNFEIVSIYQQNIIGMKKETIIKIKELATFLVREEDADKIKKRIKALDGAKNASALRRFILKDVVAANYMAMNENPIVTVDDYVNYLFPDGSYWAEIRDILMIAIYQELHERNLISEDLKVELDSEVEEEVIYD